MKKMLQQVIFASVVAWCGLAAPTNAADAPARAALTPVGTEGNPIAILYLGAGVGSGSGYGEELSRQGIAFTNCAIFEPLTYPAIKKFNVIVVDRLPPIGHEYDVFGQRMATYKANMQLLGRAVAEGAGALFYPNLADGGGGLFAGWNQEMKPWGIQILPMCIRDPTTAFETWQVSGGDCYYGWTENLAKHPVTEGLKRIYYASANLRWDDCYTAPPLVYDKNWTPLVKAMPEATVAQQVDDQWNDQPVPNEGLVLAAVRNVGKGRMGALAIHPYYIHQIGYARLAGGRLGEMAPGPVDGIVLKKGDGKIASDTGALVSNLYAWLAASSTQAGFGGYKTGDPLEMGPALFSEETQRFSPVLDFTNDVMPPSWRHKAALMQVGGNQYFPELSDPSITGEMKFHKALVGAHSELSDGKGSVAEYAAQARKAGYSMIVFTENFEKLSQDRFEQMLRECEKNSSDDFVCLPGFDIQDPDGNHFIVVAPSSYPRASWLSADGKRMNSVHMFTFSYYNHMVVAHRPGGGPLPYERLQHFQGLTVYTYRDGKQVDDGLKAYAWQVQNASMPHPVVVDELFSPTEVAAAAQTGFQQIMPADTVRHAAGYFRVGLAHFFEVPARYMISEGPIVYNWVSSPKDIGPAAENRRHFRVAIGVTNEIPLATVTLYDGQKMVRRWLPGGTDFQATADFQHSHQLDLYVVAQDIKGRRALTSAIRTVPERYHYRCGDRQNWLGDISLFNCYTGSRLPDQMDICMPIEGTAEASMLFPDVPGCCMAPKVNFPFTCNDVAIMDVTLDEKYVTAIMKEIGLDAMRSQASQPSEVYSAKRRITSFTPGQSGKYWLSWRNSTSRSNVMCIRSIRQAYSRRSAVSGEPIISGGRSGKPVAGSLANDVILDVPPGGLAGGYIALSEGLQFQKGKWGVAPRQGAPDTLPAGTQIIARFLFARRHDSGPTWFTGWSDTGFDDNPEAWLKAMGFAGDLPYSFPISAKSGWPCSNHLSIKHLQRDC